MNFDTYTDCGVVLAVDLVNTVGLRSGDHLTTPQALRTLLEEHDVSAIGTVDADVLAAVRRLRERLAAVFDAATETEAAEHVNAMLVDSHPLPQLTNHDGEDWHLHYNPEGAPLPERIAAHTAMGLAGVIRSGGFSRMSRCADDGCHDVFVDASRNRSRRYCDETCSNRANVAAHRARQRASRQPA